MSREEIKLLRNLLYEATEKSNDVYQLYSRMWDILDFMSGNKTPEFNHKIIKEYKILNGGN